MTLLSVSNLSVRFGVTTIFRDVAFTVADGDRWGIVGRNGAGKTTVFHCITGTLSPSEGAIARQPNLRIAVLDQHRNFGNANTVWAAAAGAWRHVLDLEDSLAEQTTRMSEGAQVSDEELECYGHDQERFAALGGYEFHARVDAVLQGLGFDPKVALTRPLASLSGGERGRLGLAAQLASPADLILLDEPTNHLDRETTLWLRDYLVGLRTGIIMISHDRAFLDETVDHVLHLSDGTGTAYRGGYTDFVRQREERRLALARQVEKQRAFIDKEEDYIRRNIAGQNTAQAKGRRKKLDRLPRLSPPPGAGGAMSLRLEIAERGGDQVLVADHVDVAIGDLVLARDFSATARRGDIVALVGPNGAGKSTLLATLLGERAPAHGEVRIGGSIKVSWFRQDLAQLPLDKTIYDCIADQRPLWTRGGIQNHLACFGFSGDQVQWNTSTLSGGERARAALALLTLERANCLVLDEPTNHLDVESIEALEDAIEEYEGTVILVSHDRAFLRELSTRVWAFDGTHIEDYPGPFIEWEEHDVKRRARRAREAQLRENARRVETRASETRARQGQQSDGAQERSARRTAEAREAEVQRLERRVEELTAQLANGALYDSGADGARRAARIHTDLRRAETDLDAAFALWTEAAEVYAALSRASTT